MIDNLDSLIMKYPIYFREINSDAIQEILSRYPSDRRASAILPLLHLAQSQEKKKYLNIEVISEISEITGVCLQKIIEIATFYSMFSLEPLSDYVVNVCIGAPCMLRGSDDIYESLSKIESDKVMIKKVECLGACTSAPVIEIDGLYYENMNNASSIDLVVELSGYKKMLDLNNKIVKDSKK